MKLVMAFVACMISLPVWAQEEQLPAQPVAQEQQAEDLHAQNIIARFGSVATISSQFTQEKRMALLTEPVLSKGHFSFQKEPAKIHWEYEEPFQNGFIIDGSTTYRLEKGKKTPIKGVLARNIAAQMLVWLSFDLAEITKTYHADYFEGGVTLTPKSDKNKMLESITAYFAENNPQALGKIVMQEPGGDSTTLIFTQTQINEPLPEGTFK